MSLVPDQRVVEQFAAAAADPTLHDRVRPRGLDRTAHDPDPHGCEHRVESGGELGIPIAYQELDRLSALVEIDEQVPGCWVTKSLLGWAVTPRIRMRRVACSMAART